MQSISRTGTALAAAALASGAVLAAPADASPPASRTTISSASVGLTAMANPLPIWPWTVAAPPPRRSASSGAASQTANAEADVDEPPSTPDQIDQEFIDFRRAVRNDFHEFANQFGYLGKQLYIGFNFGESIIASAVFNGTDMLRGEGVLRNLGEIAYDVVLAGVYVVVDQLYLAVPGLPPIVVLPDRPPVDHPLDWRSPLPPQPGRDLVVPFDPQPEDAATTAVEATSETAGETGEAELGAGLDDAMRSVAVETSVDSGGSVGDAESSETQPDNQIAENESTEGDEAESTEVDETESTEVDESELDQVEAVEDAESDDNAEATETAENDSAEPQDDTGEDAGERPASEE